MVFLRQCGVTFKCINIVDPYSDSLLKKWNTLILLGESSVAQSVIFMHEVNLVLGASNGLLENHMGFILAVFMFYSHVLKDPFQP